MPFLWSAICLSPAQADVYKYKDKYGKWHFTDNPPEGQSKKVIETATSANSSSNNIKELLFAKFNPNTKVEEATLSVVTVKTNSGSGSGFFITSNGYIVTNRHVVRPTSTSGWKEREQVFSERKQALEEVKLDLKERMVRLEEMKMTIDEDKEYIESDKATKLQKKQYNRYVKRYERDMKKHQNDEQKQRKMSRQLDIDKGEFGWSSSMSNFSKNFTITLKNGKELKAKLVRLSKKHDLALLKINDYTTPYLQLSGQNRPQQGTKVFAIGSPLGISDSLTTGIVTKAHKEHIITDTRILPGNSGGPLIDSTGMVLGVNTAVVSEVKNSESLGLAIYSVHIKNEFARELSGNI